MYYKEHCIKELLVKNEALDKLLTKELERIELKYEHTVFETKENKDYYSRFTLGDEDFYIAQEAYNNLSETIQENNKKLELSKRQQVSFNMTQIVLSALINPVASIIMLAINYKYSRLKRILALSLLPFIVLLYFLSMAFDYYKYETQLLFIILVFIFLVIVIISWEFNNTKNLVSHFKAILLNVSIFVTLFVGFQLLDAYDFQPYAKYTKYATNSSYTIYYSAGITPEEIKSIEPDLAAFYAEYLFTPQVIIFTEDYFDKNIVFIFDDDIFSTTFISNLHKVLETRLREKKYDFDNFYKARVKFWFIQREHI